MNKNADSKTAFKFLDAWLFVNRVKSDPRIPLANNDTLVNGPLAGYNLTRFELKIFTMVKTTDFLGSTNTNPYFFRHYNVSYFVLNVNGKQIPTEGPALNMGHE